jgi:hypothetical protein
MYPFGIRLRLAWLVLRGTVTDSWWDVAGDKLTVQVSGRRWFKKPVVR